MDEIKIGHSDSKKTLLKKWDDDKRVHIPPLYTTPVPLALKTNGREVANGVEQTDCN